MARAHEDALGELHQELAKVLKEEVSKTYQDKDGNTSRSAAMLSVARQFLKDNNIQAEESNPAMQSLIGALPSFDSDMPLQ